MNVFWREMRANWKSLAIWCGAQFFVIYAGMMKYAGYKDSGVDIGALFADMPRALKAMFGIGELDLAKVEGYYTVFFLFFMLLAGIHAIMLGAVLIAKEERDHSADFLFAKPATRSRIISAKLAAGLVNVILFNLVTWLSSLYFIAMYNNGNAVPDKVARVMVALLILQVLFLALGALFGAVMRNARTASSAATGLVLATFFLSIGISYDIRLDLLKYLTPFNYFEAKSLMFGGAFTVWSLVLSAVLIGGATFLTYRSFGKRDLAV